MYRRRREHTLNVETVEDDLSPVLQLQRVFLIVLYPRSARALIYDKKQYAREIAPQHATVPYRLTKDNMMSSVSPPTLSKYTSA